MKRKYIKIQKKQKGYIVLITIMLLATLLTTSLSFFERSANNMQMTGYNRDSAESLLLAESAMNSLLGQFSTRDLDVDLLIDSSETVNPLVPMPLPLYYMFFTSAGLLITEPTPSILQRVANGEARGMGNMLASNIVPIANNNLQISDLFVDINARPVVFTLAANNLLQTNNGILNAAAWNNAVANNNQIAAVWLEIVQNPTLLGTLQVYIGSVAIVGNSKSYVQRLIGSVGTDLGNAAGINQGI